MLVRAWEGLGRSNPPSPGPPTAHPVAPRREPGKPVSNTPPKPTLYSTVVRLLCRPPSFTRHSACAHPLCFGRVFISRSVLSGISLMAVCSLADSSWTRIVSVRVLQILAWVPPLGPVGPIGRIRLGPARFVNCRSPLGISQLRSTPISVNFRKLPLLSASPVQLYTCFAKEYRRCLEEIASKCYHGAI